jgi:hypothetical protein
VCKSNESDIIWPVTSHVMPVSYEELCRRGAVIDSGDYWVVRIGEETLMLSEHFSPMLFVPSVQHYMVIQTH